MLTRAQIPMTGEGYYRLVQALGFTHQEIAERLGVHRWASMSWRTGRRALPHTTILAIRSLIYDRVAGEAAKREVDRIIELAERGQEIPPIG